MNEFERCLKERRIVKIGISPQLVNKEIDRAKYDLEKASTSYKNEDYKWCSIQAYYSMFHCAKALVLNKGFREKSHYCLLIALKELYVKTDVLSNEHSINFEAAMDLRHEADYGLTFDKNSARIVLENATLLLTTTNALLTQH